MKDELIDLSKLAADNENIAHEAGILLGTAEEKKVSAYWKQRCLLAEKINNVNVADPDLTSEMIKAYSDYMEWRRITDEPINRLVTELTSGRI